MGKPLNVQVNPAIANTSEKIDPDDITAIMKSRAQNNKFGRGFNSIAKIRERSQSNAPKENNSNLVQNNSAVVTTKTTEVNENPVTNLQPEKKSEKKIVLGSKEKEEQIKAKKYEARQEKIKLKKQKKIEEENKRQSNAPKEN